MKEEWRPVPGYEGVYSVSSKGRVRREISRTCAKAGTILKTPKRNGYPSVDLCKDGKRRTVNVHQLVAAAFHGPVPDGQNINHKNGRRPDPRATNLEYGTQSHNVKEAYRLGLRDCRGQGNGQAKLTNRRVRFIKRSYTGQRGEITAFARRYGVSETTVRDIVAGRTWAHI